MCHIPSFFPLPLKPFSFHLPFRSLPRLPLTTFMSMRALGQVPVTGNDKDYFTCTILKQLKMQQILQVRYASLKISDSAQNATKFKGYLFSCSLTWVSLFRLWRLKSFCTHWSTVWVADCTTPLFLNTWLHPYRLRSFDFPRFLSCQEQGQWF